MAIQDDFSISSLGDIRYTGADHGQAGAGYYTVIEFHRWLQDLADDAVAGIDPNSFLDITNNTPSERQTDNIIQLINGYNIDQLASEHLYDGSIIQNNGAEIWDGLIIIAGAGADVQIVQNGAVIANDFWNTVPNGSTLKGLNSDPAQGYSHRFMFRVRTGGLDIDGRRIITQTREWGFSFSEFRINGTTRGNNVSALNYVPDNNNSTLEGTVASWADITNTSEGYVLIDVDDIGGPEPYYSQWNVNKPTRSINNFYERAKYLTKRGSIETIYGLSGELFRGITHQVQYGSLTGGSFIEATSVSYPEGTAQILGDNGVDTMWIQVLTGLPPINNSVLTQGAVTASATTITERTLSFPFAGQSTGSAIIGSYGLGIETDDLTAADSLIDLTNVTRTPPNNQTFFVNGLSVNEDYVIVGPNNGLAAPNTDINLSQFTLLTELTTANITSVRVNAPIPSDTPSTGTIRVADNTGVYRRLVYTSYTGDTFTVDPVASETASPNVADFDVVPANVGNGVFISYIDKLATATSASFSATYLADRSLFVRVRFGGTFGLLIGEGNFPIKTFETSATFGSAGGTATVIRTNDF